MNLPSRLTEKTFRRFEADIIRIVEAYPDVLVLKPIQGLQNTSYRARLSDALLSLRTFKWDTKVNMEKFLAIAIDLNIGHRGDHVISGSRENVRAWEPPDKPTSKQLVHSNFKTREDWDKLAAAIATGEVQPKRVVGLTPSDQDYLLDNYDITIIDNGDQTFTIR